MRFVLTGENWMDPATLRLSFKVRNTSPDQTLVLASGSWCLFDQVRLLVGGTEVERIATYGRAHELFRHLLMPNAWNVESTNEDGTEYIVNGFPQVTPKRVGPGQYLSFNLTPLLGILNVDKYLPLKYLGGMQLEFTLANTTEALNPLSQSRVFQIEQPQMRYSTLSLDSALSNSFSQLLLQGRALQFHIRTIHTQVQALAQGNTEAQVSLVRALSRLAGVFVSFVGPPTYTDGNGVQQITPVDQSHVHKSFLNPSQYITGIDGAADESLLNWQIQIGSKSYPEASPCSNLAESFSLLRQATGIYDGSLRTTSINEAGYRLNQFVIGVPLQIVQAPFSSVNTRSGDLLTIKVGGMNGDIRQAGRMFVNMISEQIIELRESGVTVLD